MPSLRDIQQAFRSAVLSGDASCMHTLVRTNGLTVDARVQIYRNNYQLGFVAAMQATYPVIERLGNADWFEQNTLRYQQQFPSRRGDLQYVGEHYADFLALDLAGTAFGYFSDVARLEWAYQETLIAADDAPLDPADLAAVATDDYERLAFGVRMPVRMVESDVPILAIWKANHAGGDDAAEIRLDAGPSRVLLVRHIDHVELRELPAETLLLLRRLRQGQVLGEAAATTIAQYPDTDLGACLRLLIASQALGPCQIRAHH